MKKKVLYLFPIAALLLVGCSEAEVKSGLKGAKDWAANNVVRPAKDVVDDYVDVDAFFQPDFEVPKEETKHVHNYGELVEAVEPDCEHEGHLAYYHCEECGKYFTQGKTETTLEVLTVEALGHVFGNLIPQVDPDTEHDGMKAHYECSRCHKLFNEDKEEVTAEDLRIPKLEA